jgi:aconitate hydratase
MHNHSKKVTLSLHNKMYELYDIRAFGDDTILKLPYSLRILLENLMRHHAHPHVTELSIQALLSRKGEEIPYFPARVLMQDFTGVPAIVDLAAMRDAVATAGEDPTLINPQIPVDLVIDHSVQIDHYGTTEALAYNVTKEYERNTERYSLLKWAQENFSHLRIVPPNSGICHQVNLEYIASVVQDDAGLLFPDSLVGTDSHTTMINALGVMGWGVGGIEAEAVMLGQPYFMPVPQVVGVRLYGELPTACTATDLVLSITQKLRKVGVVGKFVEFFGEGLHGLSIPDRATVANMCPEYGATMGFFPIDDRTIEYLRFTGRDNEADRTLAYAKANALMHDPNVRANYDQLVEFDLSDIEPSIAGPSRPQDRIPLSLAKDLIQKATGIDPLNKHTMDIEIKGTKTTIGDGSLAIAAITSCTNTSNPSVMLGAALLAKNAVNHGLSVPIWVKTSLAPGSRVVEEYLQTSGLLPYLEKLGFHIAAFGCTTCIGNSGALEASIEKAQRENNLLLAAALSGNRNFEGRIHSRVKASFLMSPPLVVAFALAGRIDMDFVNEPIGKNSKGQDVYLSQLWPDSTEIETLIKKHVTQNAFTTNYANVFSGDEQWRNLKVPKGETYAWDPDSTYIAKPPFFNNFPLIPPIRKSIHDARALLVMGDTVTTDHISPAGSIDSSYPAGYYLREKGILESEFNSYGSRRGNHEIMIRGTFGNTRIKHALSGGKEGGFTLKLPEEAIMPIYEAAMLYAKENTDLIVLAGKEYGTGSSRDWAAKGTMLLGIKAVVAESFERIHRSNLVGMGVLPLTFNPGQSYTSLGLSGKETFSVDIPQEITPFQQLEFRVRKPDGSCMVFPVICRLDSQIEISYYRNGGILPYVLRDIMR